MDDVESCVYLTVGCNPNSKFDYLRRIYELKLPCCSTKSSKTTVFLLFSGSCIHWSCQHFVSCDFSESTARRISYEVIFMVVDIRPFRVAYLVDINSRRQLQKINEIDDFETLVEEYIKFYKTRLIWNAISVLSSGILFVLTFKNIYFYILLFQVVFAFVFFPRKVQVTKDLQGRELMFM
ncbi:MAG: hypothetical protein ABIQ94_09210 [Chitinophagaceae bacterium]